jgi:hypothetical protein
MPNVVFVAPYFLPATVRFVASVAGLPGVTTGLVSSDPLEKLPAGLRARIAAHWRTEDALDPASIEDAARKLAARLGTVDRLLGALEELQEPLGEVRERLGIPGMNAETARRFRDKSRMKRTLGAAGVPCARHALAHSAEEARAAAATVGLPLVAKPPAGAGARATSRITSERQLEAYLAAHPPAHDRPLLLEEFLIGQEHSLETISIAGRPVWHSLTHYFPSPLEVVENPWIQWCVVLPREVDHPRYDDIRETGARALAALGMGTGLSHMEWFRRADGSLAISEVGARPPGAQLTTLTSYAHDFDLYSAWGRLMVFDRFEPPERRFAAGIAYLRGQGSGRVRAVHGLEQAQREIGGIVVEARLPRPGQGPSGSYEGEGYVLVRHERTEVVRQALSRLVTLVRVEMG